MRLATVVPNRFRALAPEAISFALIGVGNTVLYFLIYNVTLTIGAVKATVIATVITTTLAYLAHRHWTYRTRKRDAVRREYTLFFLFNLAGLLIQMSVVGIAKYSLELTEQGDRLLLNAFTAAGVGLATAFRFYVYRTLVFQPHPVDHALPTNATEALAEVFAEDAEFHQLTDLLEAEMTPPPAARPEAESIAATIPAQTATARPEAVARPTG